MISRRGLMYGAASLVAATSPADATKPAAKTRGPFLAAASSLRFAFDDIIAAYERETSQHVRIAYASTGTLVSQIENGAPYDLFATADMESASLIAQAGLTSTQPVQFARGRLALAASRSSPVTLDPGLSGLSQVIASQDLGRFAIANPQFAPYGRAARQLLKNEILWDTVKPRLAFGESVGQVTQFIATGAADAGLTAYSMCLAPRLREKIAYTIMPEDRHDTIAHGLIKLSRSGSKAAQLYDFLQGPVARDVLVRYGFAVG